MSSLIIQLQSEVIDESVDVSHILLKTYTLAKKLGLKDLELFCRNEIDGYGGGKDLSVVPDYRIVKGVVRARNPFHGTIPAIILDQEISEKLSILKVWQPVAEIETMLKNCVSNGTPLEAPYGSETLKLLLSENDIFTSTVPYLSIQPSSLKGILTKIRKVILDFSLELEQAGVTGEDMMFTNEEKIAASNITYNIHGNVYGSVSGTVTEQTVNTMNVSEIKQGIDGLNLPEVKSAEIIKIIDELPTASNKPTVIQRGLDWIERNKGVLGTFASILIGWFQNQQI